MYFGSTVVILFLITLQTLNAQYREPLKLSNLKNRQGLTTTGLITYWDFVKQGTGRIKTLNDRLCGVITGQPITGSCRNISLGDGNISNYNDKNAGSWNTEGLRFSANTSNNDGGTVSDLGVNDTLRLTSNWSFDFVARLGKKAMPNTYILTKNNLYGIIFGYLADNYEFFASSGCTTIRAQSAVPVTDSLPHQITYTYDGTTFTSYKDGVQVTNASVSTTCSTSASAFTLGNSAWEGTMYGLAIYNRKLTAAEVSHNYNYYQSLIARRHTYEGVVVFEGDSLTVSDEWKSGSSRYYAFAIDYLADQGHRVYHRGVATGGQEVSYAQGVSTLNPARIRQQLTWGISDTTTYNMPTSNYYPDQGGTRANNNQTPWQWFNAFPGKQVLVFWAGTNDLKNGTNATDTTTYITDYLNTAHTMGWPITVLLNIIDRTDVDISASRPTVNTNLINACGTPTTLYTEPTYGGVIKKCTSSSMDYLIQLASDNRIGDAGDSADTTYFMADKVHLNGTGLHIVGDYVGRVLDYIFDN